MKYPGWKLITTLNEVSRVPQILLYLKWRLRGAKNIIARNHSVIGGPEGIFAYILVLFGRWRAEGGGFNDFATEKDMGEPEAASDESAVAEYFSDLLGRGIGGHVEIFGVAIQ